MPVTIVVEGEFAWCMEQREDAGKVMVKKGLKTKGVQGSKPKGSMRPLGVEKGQPPFFLNQLINELTNQPQQTQQL